MSGSESKADATSDTGRQFVLGKRSKRKPEHQMTKGSEEPAKETKESKEEPVIDPKALSSFLSGLSLDASTPVPGDEEEVEEYDPEETVSERISNLVAIAQAFKLMKESGIPKSFFSKYQDLKTRSLLLWLSAMQDVLVDMNQDEGDEGDEAEDNKEESKD